MTTNAYRTLGHHHHENFLSEPTYNNTWTFTTKFTAIRKKKNKGICGHRDDDIDDLNNLDYQMSMTLTMAGT